MFAETEEPVLAFHRGEKTVCAFNLSATPQEIELPGITETLFALSAESADGKVWLGPNGALIARLG